MDTQQEQVPVAWVRFCSNGGVEGPILHTTMDEVRQRSGAWTPLYTAQSAQSGPAMPLSMEQFAGLVGLAREDAREKAVVYKATNHYGETCYFGVESTARAWAKSGAVEEVRLRDLRVVAAPAPDEREQHAALTDADREQDSAKRWVAALRKAIDEYHAATVARCNSFGNSAHYECQRREHAAAETLIAMLAAAPAPAQEGKQ
jgi:hypothetical protein